ncbi:Nn.00g034480.m01.CDS01 [Neocucurbitaria sp. VM-36]
MPSLAPTVSRPTLAGYTPFSPYTDDPTIFANNVLCPRYAESDPTSAPPSPASIESFDVLDNTPWRRSYISLDSRGSQSNTIETLLQRWKKNRARIIVVLLLSTLLVTGSTLGGYFAVAHEKEKLRNQ